MSRHTTTIDPTEFRRLLKRWNSHQNLRRHGAPVAELARSRMDLDRARAQLHLTVGGRSELR